MFDILTGGNTRKPTENLRNMLELAHVLLVKTCPVEPEAPSHESVREAVRASADPVDRPRQKRVSPAHFEKVPSALTSR